MVMSLCFSIALYGDIEILQGVLGGILSPSMGFRRVRGTAPRGAVRLGVGLDRRLRMGYGNASEVPWGPRDGRRGKAGGGVI